MDISADGFFTDDDGSPCLESHVPNDETIEAMKEGLRGGLKQFKTVEEMMADLYS